MELKVLHQHGWSLSALAREFGLNWRTVKREVESPAPRGYSVRVKPTALTAAQRAHVERRLGVCPGIRGTDLHRELTRDYGYAGSYPAFQRHLRVLRPAPLREPELRFETGPGLQLQADWAHLGVWPLGDGAVQLKVLVAILGYSRAPALRFAAETTRPTTLARLVDCLADLGGAPRGGAHRPGPRLLRRGHRGRAGHPGPGVGRPCGALGVVPKACRPYRAKTKGKVERLVREVKEGFLPWLSGQPVPARPLLADYDALARRWVEEVVLRAPPPHHRPRRRRGLGGGAPAPGPPAPAAPRRGRGPPAPGGPGGRAGGAPAPAAAGPRGARRAPRPGGVRGRPHAGGGAVTAAPTAAPPPGEGTSYQRLREHLAYLGLSAAAEHLSAELDRALRDRLSPTQVLERLLELEVAETQARRLRGRLRFAHYPVLKRLADFDFDFQPGLDRREVAELSTLRFVEERRNVLLLGPPGVGKSHLAIALGVAATEAGYRTYFTTAADMVHALQAAHLEGSAQYKLRRYLGPSVLVVDEMGYLPARPGLRQLDLPGRQPALPEDEHHPDQQQELRRLGRRPGRTRALRKTAVLDRLPQVGAAVTVTDDRHPLFGRTLVLVRLHSPRGRPEVVLRLPSGQHRSVPRASTDLDGPPAAPGSRGLPWISVRTLLPLAHLVRAMLGGREEPPDAPSSRPHPTDDAGRGGRAGAPRGPAPSGRGAVPGLPGGRPGAPPLGATRPAAPAAAGAAPGRAAPARPPDRASRHGGGGRG